MNRAGKQESDEERLDRLEREEEKNSKLCRSSRPRPQLRKRDMAVADALDEILTRNARNERMGKDCVEVRVARESSDEAKERQDREDKEAARPALIRRVIDGLIFMRRIFLGL